jgi:hypothetical protein
MFLLPPSPPHPHPYVFNLFPVNYKLQNIGQYPPAGVPLINCNGNSLDGCYNGKKVYTGHPLPYVLLLTLSVPFFILYGIGTPLMYMVILGKASMKRQLHDDGLRTRYGWVYTKFNERCWWFFLVDMIRKLLTVCVLVLANGNILGNNLMKSIGHVDERPCLDTDQRKIDDPSIEWCPDSSKDAKEGESIVSAK